MLGAVVRYSEDATLPSGPNHTRYIESQSFNIAYNEVIIIEWSTGKMGHIALPIRDAILPQKTVKGRAVADFLAEHPDPRMTKLYKDLPAEIAEVCMTQTSFEEQV